MRAPISASRSLRRAEMYFRPQQFRLITLISVGPAVLIFPARLYTMMIERVVSVAKNEIEKARGSYKKVCFAVMFNLRCITN